MAPERCRRMSELITFGSHRQANICSTTHRLSFVITHLAAPHSLRGSDLHWSVTRRVREWLINIYEPERSMNSRVTNKRSQDACTREMRCLKAHMGRICEKATQGGKLLLVQRQIWEEEFKRPSPSPRLKPNQSRWLGDRFQIRFTSRADEHSLIWFCTRPTQKGPIETCEEVRGSGHGNVLIHKPTFASARWSQGSSLRCASSMSRFVNARPSAFCSGFANTQQHQR